MNDFSKFNITFAEGSSTTQWKNFSRSFFSLEKTSRGFRGGAPRSGCRAEPYMGCKGNFPLIKYLSQCSLDLNNIDYIGMGGK